MLRRLVRVGADAGRRFSADGCPQQAAAIAYRVLFSIAPLAIVLVSIFGLVLQDDGVREDVVDRIVDALPVSAAGRQDVEDAITAIATPASAAGLVSLLVFGWAATGMMTALRRGLGTALGVTVERPLVRGKLVDVVLVVGAGVLVLVTVGITLFGEFVQRAGARLGELGGVGAGGLTRAASFLVSVAVVLLLYRFVPARRLAFRDALAGALVTAVLMALIALASSWIYAKTTGLSVVYGSLTAALVFLYSAYLYASALLLGAEVAAAWSRPPGLPGGPFLEQLRLAVRGLFTSRERPTDG